MATRHEALLQVTQLQAVERQHVLLLAFLNKAKLRHFKIICLQNFHGLNLIITHLFVLEPGDALGGENEPVVPGAALHNAQIVYAHEALADHLIAKCVSAGFIGVLR